MAVDPAYPAADGGLYRLLGFMAKISTEPARASSLRAGRSAVLDDQFGDQRTLVLMFACSARSRT